MNRLSHPIRLSPICKDAVWGGTRLSKRYHTAADTDRIAESWLLSANAQGISASADPCCLGAPVTELTGTETTDFPLLIKFLDSAEPLSVQVHPDKTEMWYIMEADEGATLLCGFDGSYDEAAFRSALADGTAEAMLRRIPVKKGDVIFLPAGTVHAIGGGILLCEIQQNSTATYRLYDYGRGRPLHVEEGLAAIRDFDEDEVLAARFDRRATRERNGDLLACCRHFVVRHYDIEGETAISLPTVFDTFVHLCCLGGEGVIGALTEGAEPPQELFPFRAGDSFLLPRNMGELYVKSTGAELLITSP